MSFAPEDGTPPLGGHDASDAGDAARYVVLPAVHCRVVLHALRRRDCSG